MQLGEVFQGNNKNQRGKKIKGHKRKIQVSAPCNKKFRDLPDGPVIRNLPVNAEDVGSMSGQGRSLMP